MVVGLIVAARQSGRAFECRARRRTSGAALLFDSDFSAIAIDVHFEDRRVVNKAIYGGERHDLVWKNSPPFAEGLICRDQHGAPLVARADQLEQDARLRLVLGDIGEIIED